MPFLYPRLPLPRAQQLAVLRSQMTVEGLAEVSRLKDPSAQYAPTGGSRATEAHLAEIQKKIRERAASFGYPNPADENRQRIFDIQCGRDLISHLQISPSEASHIEMWAFFTCILVPDVVVWRWSREGSASLERFIGGNRGLRRNAFGRLWWRTYLLKDPINQDPYELLDWLNEDELVQVTERPETLAADPRLLLAFCWSFVNGLRRYHSVPRRELMREAVKRIYRLKSIILIEAMDDQTLDAQMKALFRQTAEAYGLKMNSGAH